MSNTPELSVIISTYNRANYLYISLDSLVRQTYPSDHWEIILVDNNSSDGTVDLVRAYKNKLPHLRYVFESKQGISHARNRGAREAGAPYILYLDDDAEAPEIWVSEALKALEQAQNAVAFGGPVFPNWEGPQPEWLPPQFLGFFTYLNYGLRPVNLTQSNGVLLGANIGFEKKAFFEYGAFSAKLGRIGSNLLSGEETQLLYKLKESGRPILYLPKCGVKHLVLPERRNVSFLLNRMYGDGLSQVILDLENGRLQRRKLGRRLLFEYKSLLFNYWKSLFPPSQTKEKIFYKAIVARHKGRIKKIWQEWI